MRLVATLLVRDEADVIKANIEHHLAQGVDYFVATDNGSVDGTTQILESYRDKGILDIIYEPEHDYQQGPWVTRMVRLAAEKHGASWIINIDADEFWLPKDRAQTLAEVLATVSDDIGKIRAWRQDLVGFPSASTNTDWSKRLLWRNKKTVSERGTPLGPKVVHRTDPLAVVTYGNHEVEGPSIGRFSDDEPIDILHVPLRSWEQFKTKIKNGGSAYASNNNVGPDVGWHWRNDYERLKRGELLTEYQARCLSPRKLSDGLSSGEIVPDLWLSNEIAAFGL
jgi:glycosyltransferase involved in cell wall biosynthesis